MTDAEWERLSRLLPAPSRLGRPQQVDLREVINALLYQLMTGCQWRVAFAFDPVRRAMLLVAGDKSGGSERRFYRELIRQGRRALRPAPCPAR